MLTSPTTAFFDVTPADKRFFCLRLPSSHSYYSKLAIQNDPIPNLSKVQILSVHVSSIIDSSALKMMPALRLIACRATGVDHIDLAAAKKRGVTVCNVAGYGANPVAEYSFGLMLSLSRKLMMANAQIKSGLIDHTLITGTDLYGKTLGIIGTGAIGRHMIQIAGGFGMKVVAYDPYPDAKLELEYNMSYCTLAHLCERADIISLHAPYTRENHHLLGRAEFSKMKKGVLLVNTARGELVDTSELLVALHSGVVGAAALDVFEDESILEVSQDIELLDHPTNWAKVHAVELLLLEKMPNVILSPHNAYNSKEALQLVRQISLDNINSFLAGKPSNTL